jgi:hypothetical protein
VITHQNNLLGPENNGDQTLRLRRLCGLVNQDSLEAELGDTRITSPNTGATDNIRILVIRTIVITNVNNNKNQHRKEKR